MGHNGQLKPKWDLLNHKREKWIWLYEKWNSKKQPILNLEIASVLSGYFRTDFNGLLSIFDLTNTMTLILS